MDTHTCYNCEEQFKVEPIFETESEVTFCPFCGSDLAVEEFNEEIDELDDENNWD